MPAFTLKKATKGGGQLLSATPNADSGYRTQVFDNELHDAEQLVSAIISANAGGPLQAGGAGGRGRS